MVKPYIKDISDMKDSIIAEDKLVSAATPISMNIIVPKGDYGNYYVLARLTWLCKQPSGTLFCLTTTYQAQSAEDEDYLASLPFLSDKYYTNYALSSNIIMSSVDNYLTDLNFTRDEGASEYECWAFYQGKDLADDKLYCITMMPEVYATMKYVDSYILNKYYNIENLYLALNGGAQESMQTIDYVVSKAAVLDSMIKTDKITKQKFIISRVEFRTYSKSGSPVECMLATPIEGRVKKVKSNTGSFYDERDINLQKQVYKFKDTIDDESYQFIKTENENNVSYLFILSDDCKSALLNEILEPYLATL